MASPVAVIGGGNFGTAIARIVAGNGIDCALWMRDAAYADEVAAVRENRRYLPGHRLADNVRVGADLAAAVHGADVLFVTVPSGSFAEVARGMAPHIAAGAMLVSGTKGVLAGGPRLMSDVLAAACPQARVGALSGPNLAEEIAAGQYTATVIASADPAVVERVQALLRNRTLRVYGSADLHGVQLAGALKNIYAIVCGMAAAIGVGENTLALLITRSLAEMSRFAVSMGADPLTFLGLAGVGDLMATCHSPLSRNYQLGQRIARGQTLAEAMESLGRLAEGVNTLAVVHAEAARRGVYMPLAGGLHRLLFEGAQIGEVISTLMSAEQRRDVEFSPR
jgi:glycerol-3-phosphate dehydrogenase (NAD(P)+)